MLQLHAQTSWPALSLCIKLSNYCRQSFLIWEFANEQLTEHQLLPSRPSSSCAICTEDGTDGQARAQTVLTLFSSEAFTQKYLCQWNRILYIKAVSSTGFWRLLNSHSKCVSAKLKNFQIPSKQNSDLVWWADPSWIPRLQRHSPFSAGQKREIDVTSSLWVRKGQGDIIHQLPSWAKQTRLRKKNLISYQSNQSRKWEVKLNLKNTFSLFPWEGMFIGALARSIQFPMSKMHMHAPES